MRRRAFTGIRLHKFLPFVALGVAAACGSSNDDFFKDPNGMAGAKQSGQGGDAGSDGAGRGGASGGDATGGASGSGATAGAGGTSDPGGTGGKDSKGGKGGSKGGQGGSAGTSKGGAGGHLDGGKGGSGGSGGSAMPGGDGGGGADGGSAGTGEGGDAGSPGGMSGSGGDMSLAGAGGSVAGAGGSTAGSGGSAAGAGGSGGAPPVTCGHDGDCDSGEYCQKSACEASTGTCQLKAESCKGADAELAPVCGCDGMTYYSVCVAEREGVNVTSSGECTSNQATCTRAAGGSSCSPARDMARCYRPRTNCSGLSAAEGVCWVLPDECPDEPKTTEYCAEAKCYGFCELLETDNAVRRDSSNCTP